MSKITLLPILLLAAQVWVQAEPVKSPVTTFPLGEVQLLDSPFKQNMERNADYLLSIEPDRLLHNTRLYAGLEPKGELYGGWEAKGIAGHTLGHYLTAISQQYAATGDKRFKARVDYIVSEMAVCQKAYGDGYIGALPPKEMATLRGLESGKVNLNGAFFFAGGAWVPWYTEHKVLAGLIDAWTLGGCTQAKDVALELAAFTDKVTRNLPPDELQKMLGVEHGGMLDSLVQLYELTGDKKWLDVSQRFYHKAIFDPLAAGQDSLDGRHANTQIPKIIGEAREYEATGDGNGRKIAENFWNIVVKNRTWVIGGNSDREHFFRIGTADRHLGPATAETCNTYNMLKLTEHLFEWQPSVEKADYYERALYNQILGSQEPGQAMFTYFVSLKPGSRKVYSTPFDSFWCCVGSGMENHTKYGEAIYFHGADNLYVSLFIPSVLTWKEKSLVLEQRTKFPFEAVTEFTFRSAPSTPIEMNVRCPGWLVAAPTFTLNGEPVAVDAKAGSFATISRTWKKGDVLRVTLPMGLRTEPLEGNPNKIAFRYGPTVLAGDLGPAPEAHLKDQLERANEAGVEAPVLVSENGQDLLAAIKPVSGEPLSFQTQGIGQPKEITLRPFFQIPYNYYNIYWDVFTPADWQKRQANLATALSEQRIEESLLVDEILPGEQQSEVDHGLLSDHSTTGDFRDRKWRDAKDGGYFSYVLKVLPDGPQMLRCTWWGEEAGVRTFDILGDGKVIARQTLARNQPGQFFQVDYPLPPALLTGKKQLTIRFEPAKDNIAGGLFHAAIVKGVPEKK